MVESFQHRLGKQCTRLANEDVVLGAGVPLRSMDVALLVHSPCSKTKKMACWIE